MSEIVILRLGHRPERDARVTTHVGLTSRVLGASGMILTTDDKSVAESIERVREAWGGSFWVKTRRRISLGHQAMERKRRYRRAFNHVRHQHAGLYPGDQGSVQVP